MTVETTTKAASGVDRRSALKKAAAAAGIAAWATPTVQALTPGIAAAQTVTGCEPDIGVTLFKTGPTCQCVTAPSVSCCSDISYRAEITVSCGPTCGGTVANNLGVTSDRNVPNGCPTPGLFPRFDQCNGQLVVQVTGTVTCPDGIVQNINQAVTATCVDCVVPASTSVSDATNAPEDGTQLAPSETVTTDPASTPTEPAPAATDAAPVVTDPAPGETEPASVITDAAPTTDSP